MSGRDSEQDRLRGLLAKESELAALEKDVLFGVFALRRGYVTQGQLDECVRAQAGRPLREILREKGILSDVQTQELLDLEKDGVSGDGTLLPARLHADPMALLEFREGQRLGRYRLLEVLGEGGAGVVFRARDEELGREVALKMLKTVGTFSPTQIERFQREERNAARLRHPGIVTVYEIGREGTALYYTMEVVSGRPFNEIEGDLTNRVEILVKVARTVHYAHEQGVIHRDLKPANVLVDAQGEPHLLDFGLSRDLETPSDLSRSGGLLGTPHYMSPEQAEGRVHEVDARTDVYALGAILYETLAGRVPFPGDALPDVVRRLLTQEPQPPPGPPGLVTVCLKAIEKDPARRYPTAAAFADDLARFLAGEPILARPPSLIYGLRKWLARHPYALPGAGLACLAIVFALMAYQRKPGTEGEMIGPIPRPGLVVWLKADEGIDAGSSTVMEWKDQSGQNNHARQAIASRRPLLVHGAINGRPAVRFDGEDDFLELPPGFKDFSGGLGAFVVARLAGETRFRGFFELTDDTGDNWVCFGGGDTPGMLRLWVNPAIGGTPPPNINAREAIEVGECGIFAAIQNASGVVTLYTDGCALRTRKTPVPSGVTRNRASLARALPSKDYLFLQGDIAEVILYGRGLSDAQRRQVQRYLELKYFGGPSASTALRGLRAEYFDRPGFTNLSMTRTDAHVDFEWGTDAPDPSMDADKFFVRWTGQVEAQFSETYTFHADANGGVRLWIDGKRVIDEWRYEGHKVRSGTIELQAGRRYDLRMEYFKGRWFATAKLFWESPSTVYALVPRSRLFLPPPADAKPK